MIRQLAERIAAWPGCWYDLGGTPSQYPAGAVTQRP